MFEKYNLVLRGGPGVTEAEGKAAPHMLERFRSSCKGNTYVTTLHVLNSCIVKLSKLKCLCTRRVYRGVSRGGLPDIFWKADKYGVRGGVEPAFMSTTTDRDVAMMYAHQSGGGLLMEFEQTMFSRGADLKWLSQYPHEAEVLFGPLSGLEMRSTRTEGASIVAEMIISVNLTAQPIERVM